MSYVIKSTRRSPHAWYFATDRGWTVTRSRALQCVSQSAARYVIIANDLRDVKVVKLVPRKAKTLPPYPPAERLISQEDAVFRLCKLASAVWSAFDPRANEASDCFCREGRWLPEKDFRNYGQSITWIEAVVHQALKDAGK